MKENDITESLSQLSSFFVVGVNYKKSDTITRGLFSVSTTQYENLLNDSENFGICHFFIVSTCNRTEIFGFAKSTDQLSSFLCSQTKGSLEVFNSNAYTASGPDAVKHLFTVAAGLDSQILGDYEIVGQIKQAAKISKKANRLNTFLERLINEVLQASKSIRTNTMLSSGSVSVSFAAIQFIKNYSVQNRVSEILLIGTGKIGSNTCKNLADYLPEVSVTVLNRSDEKSEALANAHKLNFDSFTNLQACITNADVVIVATNSPVPIVLQSHVATQSKQQLLIDLSVPCNIETTVDRIAGIKLVNVDQLSKLNDETLLRRANDIPKVIEIIEKHMCAFTDWHNMRKNVPMLLAVKSQLQALPLHQYGLSIAGEKNQEQIQKVINGMALKLRSQNNPGCQYIEAMHDYIAHASN